MQKDAYVPRLFVYYKIGYLFVFLR